MARPQKEINWDLVEKKMEAGCSAKEICGGLCDTDTFYHRFKERYGCSFGDYSAKFYDTGNSNIRLTQYMKALQGNNNMLFLLGKERLGQGKEEVQKSPFEDVLKLSHENMILRAELDAIKDKLNGDKPEAK